MELRIREREVAPRLVDGCDGSVEGKRLPSGVVIMWPLWLVFTFC